MEQQTQIVLAQRSAPALTPRAVASLFFRQWRKMLITFVTLMIGVAIAVVLVPLRYQSEMKVMIERERFDPVVTSSSSRDVSGASRIDKLSVEAVNSEVDLLQNRDLLRDVVLATGLHNRLGWLTLLTLPSREEPYRIDAAINGLQNNLDVEPPQRSNLITVTYTNKDPVLAKQVLHA